MLRASAGAAVASDSKWSVGKWRSGLLACVAGLVILGYSTSVDARHPHYGGVHVGVPYVAARPNYGISYWGSAYHRAPAAAFYAPRYYAPRVNYYRGYGYGGLGYGYGYNSCYPYRAYRRYPVSYYGIYSSYYPSFYASPWIDPWFGVAPVGGLFVNQVDPLVNQFANPVVNAAVPNGNPAAARNANIPARPAARDPFAPAAQDAFAGGRLVDLGGANQASGNRPVRAILAKLPSVVNQAANGGGVDMNTIRQVASEVATARNRVPANAEFASREPAGSTIEDRRRASKYVEQGDALFAKGRYLEATTVYKKADHAATDLAQPFFRQGFAYIAAGRYDRATEAFREGFGRDPNYLDSGFRLGDLYGADESTKQQHQERLAQAALDADQDADLMFLVGMSLHFDGTPDRAAPFFRRAAQLAAVAGSTTK